MSNNNNNSSSNSGLKQQDVVAYITTHLEAILASHSAAPSPTPGTPTTTDGERLVSTSSPANGGVVGSTNPLGRLKVNQYVSRLAQFLQCPMECLLVGLALMQRLEAHSTELATRAASFSQDTSKKKKVFQDDTSSDDEADSRPSQQSDLLGFGKDKAQLLTLFLATTVIGIKSLCDDFESMVMYAHVGGVHPKVLCMSELKALTMLDFNCSVDMAADLAPMMVDCGCDVDAVEALSAPMAPAGAVAPHLKLKGANSKKLNKVEVEAAPATPRSTHLEGGGLSDDDDSYPTPTSVLAAL